MRSATCLLVVSSALLLGTNAYHVPSMRIGGFLDRRSALAGLGGMSSAFGIAVGSAAAAETKVDILKTPDLGNGLPTQALKAGDYIRLDYKGYLGGFGETLIDSTEKTGPFEFQMGVGATFGTTGMKANPTKIPVLPGIDAACIGKAVGTKFNIEIPAELAFGKGGVTGTGYQVPAGATVYYTVRIRSRVFSGLLDRPQENFLEEDQVGKLNKLLGVTQ